eukprot:354551_1
MDLGNHHPDVPENSPWQTVTTDTTGNNGIANNETNTTETITGSTTPTGEENVGNENEPFVNVVHTIEQPLPPVSGDHINAKVHEYSLLEQQLARLEEEGPKVQRAIVSDTKQLKRQMKRTVKTRNEEDTDTDEYKDSPTTTSDPTSRPNGIGTLIYAKLCTLPLVLPWYKTKT